MPAPALRRYAIQTIAVQAYTAVHPVVPAARALTGRIVVANTAGAINTFYLRIGSPTATRVRIASQVTFGVGETWEQAGVVVQAGEVIEAYTEIADGISVTFFGEEVDN